MTKGGLLDNPRAVSINMNDCQKFAFVQSWLERNFAMVSVADILVFLVIVTSAKKIFDLIWENLAKQNVIK